MFSLVKTARHLVAGEGKLSSTRNALSVDLEEYFTVQNLDRIVPRDRWPSQPLRAASQTRRLLDLFDERGAKATFFALGWVADRERGLVQEIHRRGHEVAAHSYWHRLVFEMTPAEFREDLRRVRGLLEDLIGCGVIGYRAPTYSVTRRSLWALEILAEEGFLYSSSVFPVLHDRYGIPDFSRAPVELPFGDKKLIEFPLTTLRTMGKNLPIAGGGYLRLMPARLIAAGIAHVNQNESCPAMVYLHPWEIDPEIPRFRQGFFKDTRGYLGLETMLSKLDYLLTAFHFDRVDRILGLRGAAS